MFVQVKEPPKDGTQFIVMWCSSQGHSFAETYRYTKEGLEVYVFGDGDGKWVDLEEWFLDASIGASFYTRDQRKPAGEI